MTIYTSDYKSRLLKLDMFPLVLLYEYYDLLQMSQISLFRFRYYCKFSSTSTRSSANFKLYHSKYSTNNCRHFYFNRLPRLWNSLPVFSLDLYTALLLQAPTQECLVVKIQKSLRCQQSMLFHYLCPCTNCCVTFFYT